MKVHQLYTKGPQRNFNHLVELSDTELMCIDPLNVELILETADSLGKKISYVVNTHHHWDHIGENDNILSKVDAKLWISEHDRNEISGADRLLKDREVLTFDYGTIEVFYAPGHTMGHICLLVKSNNGGPDSLIAGDTIFNAGVGNCHNGGDPEVLYETIDNVFKSFDDSCLIYPGHDYLVNNLEFTLSITPNNEDAKSLLFEAVKLDPNEEFMITNFELERKINCFFRLDDPAIAVHLGVESANRKEIFLKLRELRNKW